MFGPPYHRESNRTSVLASFANLADVLESEAAVNSHSNNVTNIEDPWLRGVRSRDLVAKMTFI